MVVLEHEGLVFALDGPGVCVLSVGGEADVPALTELPAARVVHLLADGETFRLDSRGEASLR